MLHARMIGNDYEQEEVKALNEIEEHAKENHLRKIPPYYHIINEINDYYWVDIKVKVMKREDKYVYVLLIIVILDFTIYFYYTAVLWSERLVLKSTLIYIVSGILFSIPFIFMPNNQKSDTYVVILFWALYFMVLQQLMHYGKGH